jgi:hypothetical protein
MWAVAAPVAFVAVAFVVRRAVLERDNDNDYNDEADTCTSVVIESDVIKANEMMEAGVPIITDLVNWLDEGSERMAITRKPVLMKVQNGDVPSICLDFVAGGVDFKLWVSGPEYMGAFPRLTAPADTEKSVVLEERSAVCLERAVTALQRV